MRMKSVLVGKTLGIAAKRLLEVEDAFVNRLMIIDSAIYWCRYLGANEELR